MALIRRGGGAGRFAATIWPGFVDAMTALLMVMMFVLTIFVVVQSVMRDRITAQDQSLTDMAGQVAALAQALGASEQAADALRGDLAREAEARAAEAARMTAINEAAEARIAAQRDEIDAGAEAARLAAARREALEALIADLRRREAQTGQALAAAEAGAQDLQAVLSATQAEAEALRGDLDDARLEHTLLRTSLADAEAGATGLAARLSEAEAARLVEAAAAEALRARLAGAEATLAARDLALEAARREGAEALTLLAAAQAARDAAQTEAAHHASEAEARAALLAAAEAQLSDQQALSVEGARQVTALNLQLADLRDQMTRLQAVLDASDAQQGASDLRLEALGAQLNTALLRAAEAERARASAEADRALMETAKAEAEAARAALEAEARARAEAEAQDLARYRSEFFGRLSQILAGREGVQVVGDRFVFSSEVLFGTGEATLSAGGRDQIRRVSGMLEQIAGDIPEGIDWVIRVDGHTDDQPLSGTGRFRDNWELSQARALAVVRYMVDDLGFPPDRLIAAGFGEYRPVVAGTTPEARAQNRRIELKLTER